MLSPSRQSSSLWHIPFGTLGLLEQRTILGGKQGILWTKYVILVHAHLSTEPQPLIRGLYVICHNEENLLPLPRTIKSMREMEKQKVKPIAVQQGSNIVKSALKLTNIDRLTFGGMT